ncbi:hypothetical protein SRABI128_04274 [Microbacterium sp. Bi128]|nr:hypothetical protein SRABI128_04274 [Microbacterium sp. Bi128]
MLVAAGHLAPEDAVEAVTTGARDVMNLPLAGPIPGARADLVAVRADSLGEAVAFASADRVVLHRGRVVARTTVSTRIAAPTATPAPTADASAPALPTLVSTGK